MAKNNFHSGKDHRAAMTGVLAHGHRIARLNGALRTARPASDP